jgi:hypothetical protein
MCVDLMAMDHGVLLSGGKYSINHWQFFLGYGLAYSWYDSVHLQKKARMTRLRSFEMLPSDSIYIRDYIYVL